MRYLARTAKSNLYDETTCCGVVDSRLDSFCTTLKDLVSLAEHLRGNCQLGTKCEANARKNFTNGLKDLDNLFKVNEKLPLNISDFLVFSTLGSLFDANTQKTYKGLKSLKSRWDCVKGDAKFTSLIGSGAKRIFG